MALVFRINEGNFDAIKEQTEQFAESLGAIVLTGSGQFFRTTEKAIDKARFADPNHDEERYFITFKKGDKFPKTLKELIDLFVSARLSEDTKVKSTVAPYDVVLFNKPTEVKEASKAKEVKPTEVKEK